MLPVARPSGRDDRLSAAAPPRSIFSTFGSSRPPLARHSKLCFLAASLPLKVLHNRRGPPAVASECVRSTSSRAGVGSLVLLVALSRLMLLMNLRLCADFRVWPCRAVSTAEASVLCAPNASRNCRAGFPAAKALLLLLLLLVLFLSMEDPLSLFTSPRLCIPKLFDFSPLVGTSIPASFGARFRGAKIPPGPSELELRRPFSRGAGALLPLV